MSTRLKQTTPSAAKRSASARLEVASGAARDAAGALTDKAAGGATRTGRSVPGSPRAGNAAHAASSQRAPRAGRERRAELDALGLAFRGVLRGLGRLRGRDTHLAGSELSHAQYELLAELDERGELSAGQLATAARLTPATVTQMLEHLAASGHVERARLERDRRVVVSRLTSRGRRELEAKRARWQSRWERALRDVRGEDLRAAAHVLTRLQAMFEDGERSAPVDGES